MLVNVRKLEVVLIFFVLTKLPTSAANGEIKQESDMADGCSQPPCNPTTKPAPNTTAATTSTYRPPSANLKKVVAVILESNDTAAQSSPDCSLKCYNGGHCESHGLAHLVCRCAIGYQGPVCQFSVCNDYCENGRCFVDWMGQPQCQCQLGYYGSRCERSMCNNFCHNGRCDLSDGRPLCLCDADWTGPRCTLRQYKFIIQSNKACDYYCLNGGTCQLLSAHQEPVCTCLPKYGGLRCETSKPGAPSWETIIICSTLFVSFVGIGLCVIILRYKNEN